MVIPRHNAAPKLLRAENEVRGLRSLVGRDATRVEQASLFIDFSFAQIAKSVAAGQAAIPESPARSLLWGFQQLKEIRKMPGWRRDGAGHFTMPAAGEAEGANSRHWSLTCRRFMH